MVTVVVVDIHLASYSKHVQAEEFRETELEVCLCCAHWQT